MKKYIAYEKRAFVEAQFCALASSINVLLKHIAIAEDQYLLGVLTFVY